MTDAGQPDWADKEAHVLCASRPQLTYAVAAALRKAARRGALEMRERAAGVCAHPPRERKGDEPVYVFLERVIRALPTTEPRHEHE